MLLFSEFQVKGNNAGYKARIDVEAIAKEYGCLPIKRTGVLFSKGFLYKINRFISGIIDRMRFLSIKGETVVFQYPTYCIFPFVGDKALVKQLSRKNKMVAIIHDVEYIRNDTLDEKDETIHFLKGMDVIICHNMKMMQRLSCDGVPQDKLVSLELFDYLLPSSENSSPIHYAGQDVVFAGNLSKSQFIDQLENEPLGFRFHLYGNGWKGCANQNIIYEGTVSPDELVSRLAFSYGLVWDGDSIQTCSGAVGNYTRYNNPHKLSLYLAAGMPVIVWSESAIADFVLKNKVGIVVDSLKDIGEKINSVTDEQYESFLNNVKTIQTHVILGYYTKTALKKAEIIITERNNAKV